MANVLYLLGAGASAGKFSSYSDELRFVSEIRDVIPSVYNMKNRLKYLIYEVLPKYDFRGIKSETIGKSQIIGARDSMRNDLIWFLKILDREPFVDVLAETLYYTDQSNFRRLQVILSIYLIWEQCNNGVDLRYKTFLTTLLSSLPQKLKLPANIKIFSWNYDYQLEEAFVEKRNLLLTNKYSEYLESIILTRNEIINNKNDYEGFKIIKLNGSAETIISVETNEITKNAKIGRAHV